MTQTELPFEPYRHPSHAKLPPFTPEQVAAFDELYRTRAYDGSDLPCVLAARGRRKHG